MSWITIVIVAAVAILLLYLIFAGTIAILFGKRLAKMSVDFDEEWDELK